MNVFLQLSKEGDDYFIKLLHRLHSLSSFHRTTGNSPINLKNMKEIEEDPKLGLLKIKNHNQQKNQKPCLEQ